MTRTSKTRTAILILFIQAGIFFLHAPRARSAEALQAEKLIVGFEQAELSRGAHISREEKPGPESWFYLLERPEGFDFAARFEWPGETNRAWTWHCQRGAHTEGELALVATVAPADREKRTATYCQTEFLSYFYANIRRGFVEAQLLMTSFQWLVKARPDLRDWSDYDLLWVDVRCDAAPVELWLALEDNLLEPPVMRTYKIPVGEWVTLELDLKEATRVRELDLAKITNFWLMGRSSVQATARIDNIRIVKQGMPAPNNLPFAGSGQACPRGTGFQPVGPTARMAVPQDAAYKTRCSSPRLGRSIRMGVRL